MAAAVSFYALLSVVPLLTVGVALLALFVGGSDVALMDMKDSVQRYLPASDQMIIATLRELKRDKGLLGSVGLIGLLVAAIIAFTWLAAKIYRVGVLLYGKRPSFREIARLVRAA